MDFFIRKIKADPLLIDKHPIFGDSSKTNNELLVYISSQNTLLKSELDIYGRSGFLSAQYFSDGHELYEYTAENWHNYNRDPSFAIRTISNITQIQSDKIYYPVWTPELPFQFVYSDHYTSTGIANIITIPSNSWTNDAPKLIFEEELSPINKFGNMLRPTRESFLANVIDATNKSYYETAGYYVGRMWQNYNVFKYKHYVHNILNPQFLNETEVNYYKNAKYIAATGLFNGYGSAGLAVINYNGKTYNGIVEHMQTRVITYSNGALVGVGVIHEWLSGHSIVLPIQETIKNELIAKNKLSIIRKFQDLGPHMEGFTNIIELNSIALGAYNKIIGTVDGTNNPSVVLSSEIDYFIALGAIQSASRIGIRMSSDIALNFSQYDITWGEALDLWYDNIGTPTISIMKRALNGLIMQNSNYCPPTMFLKGAELKYKQELGDKWSFIDFFKVAVLDNIQPSTIESANINLQKWADAKKQTK